MAKTATIRARAEPELNAEARAVLPERGPTPPQAITLYHREIVRGREVPFPLRLLHPSHAWNV